MFVLLTKPILDDISFLRDTINNHADVHGKDEKVSMKIIIEHVGGVNDCTEGDRILSLELVSQGTSERVDLRCGLIDFLREFAIRSARRFPRVE